MTSNRTWLQRTLAPAAMPALATGLATILATTLLGCGADPAAPATTTSDASGATADASGANADAGTNGDASHGGDAGSATDAAAAAAPQPLPALETTSVLVDTNPDPRIVEVDLTAETVKHKLSADTPELPMFLYNGKFPGPTLRARVGDKVIVHFKNNLNQKTTVHWHGLRIPDSMDGSPRVQKPVEPGGTFTYTFTVPDAGTYWYHPHVRAHEQVERGLYGAIVIQEAENIAFKKDRMLVVDDMRLNSDGTMAKFDVWSHPVTMHGRSGNVLLLNGEQIPLDQVKAKKGDVERWRLVNTANARTMTIDVNGPVFVRVIGTDGGLLAEPYDIDGKKFALPVGARYDLEVTYYEAGTVKLRQHVPIGMTGGSMQYKAFTMQSVLVADDPSVKQTNTPVLPKPTPIGNRVVDRTVELIFDSVQDPKSPAGLTWTINGSGMWKEPIFTFEEGQTVIINIHNKGGPEHPFHLHGQFFEILSVNGVNPKLPGLKDTVLVSGQSKVRIKAYLDNPGMWMAHCHILEHAELGMMSEFFVKPKTKK